MTHFLIFFFFVLFICCIRNSLIFQFSNYNTIRFTLLHLREKCLIFFSQYSMNGDIEIVYTNQANLSIISWIFSIYRIN